jgi:hypothetical protein
VANVLQLGDKKYTLGDLTGAHLEDNYEAVRLFSSITGLPTKEQFSATLTLAHLALVAGGATMTREEMRGLIRMPQTVLLIGAVSVALGFPEAKKDPGEAGSPEASPS